MTSIVQEGEGEGLLKRQDCGAAVSSMTWSIGQAEAGGVTQHGVLDRCWAEVEIPTGMLGSEGGG